MRVRPGLLKSMKSIDTLPVSMRLPIDRYMPLPSYDGKASVEGSMTFTNPGTPPLYDTSGHPSRSEVPRKKNEAFSTMATCQSSSASFATRSSSRLARRVLSKLS